VRRFPLIGIFVGGVVDVLLIDGVVALRLILGYVGGVFESTLQHGVYFG
jgi:hypothetical protein